MIKQSVKKQEEYEPVGLGYLHGSHVLIGLLKAGRTKRAFFFMPQTDGSFNKFTHELKILTAKGKPEKIEYCSNFQIVFERGVYVLSYMRTTSRKKEMVFANLYKETMWKVVAETPIGDRPLYMVPHISYKGEYIAYTKDKNIRIGVSKNFKDWRMSALVTDPSLMQFIPNNARMFGVINIAQGILVVYDYLEEEKTGGFILKTGAILCSALQPYKIIWVSQAPLWSQPVRTKDELIPLGCFSKIGEINLYWHSKKANLFSVVLPPVFPSPKSLSEARLSKFVKNPVIAPNPKHKWESTATFNPAAILIDGVIHLLYRAMGSEGISYLGYAHSHDGSNFNGRQAQPAYTPRELFEGGKGNVHLRGKRSSSGGGWGGCEDPRLSMIDDVIYLTYVAYDGSHPPRVALSSISKENFLKKRWNKWTWPILISPPNVVDKNACILPEKVDGKYVVFHRIFPNILIDYVDDLDFEDGKFLKGEFKIGPRPSMWDSRKLGVGATPIKTKIGWLVIYQGVDDRQDSQYKIGAMILDFKDLSKVLYRTSLPILVPDMDYENQGFKSGVVYPCGAVVKDGTLFVYYGGADSYVCVASANLESLLDKIVTDTQASLEVKKVNLT